MILKDPKSILPERLLVSFDLFVDEGSFGYFPTRGPV
jgi:hypothetical protein